MSALALLKTLNHDNKRLSEASSIMKPLPQVLKNAKISNERKKAAMQDEDIINLIAEEEKKLNKKGRILVRPSGTEPIIRVMIEGEDIQQITKMAKRIVELLNSRYGI